MKFVILFLFTATSVFSQDNDLIIHKKLNLNDVLRFDNVFEEALKKNIKSDSVRINFIVNENCKIENFEIEKECVRSVYKISDFKSQEEAEQNTRKIIFPYSILKGVATPIQEKDFKLKFPKCYSYLLTEKERLINRDKGKVNFEPFYVWGRTQGLTKIGKKILNPTFSQKPRFLLVNEEESFFTNGYGLFFREQTPMGLFEELINPITKSENIDVVQKILNSIVMDYYVTKTSVAIEGGYPCYQKNFIENFTIPDLTIEEINLIRQLANQDDVDEFLINKYQLNLPTPNLAV